MSKDFWVQPVTLTSDEVTLRPLTLDDVSALAEVVRDGELWKLWYTMVPEPDNVESFIQTAIDRREANGDLAFAVERNGKVVGTTRYMNVDNANHRLEIGTTFYAASWQRTVVNTACKRLLLGHAFETLGAIAVEFRTHWHNQGSRNAIARLGAKQDGVLRNHLKYPNGAHRDTVVFSIIESEWPVVKRSLDFRLSQKY